MHLQSVAESPESSGRSDALHVLDLPPLHTKPSASSLLDVLSDLTVKPTSWDETCGSGHAPSINEDGIPAYLTRIIASPLIWITSDKNKEEIWEVASTRLAERSGRSAMPSLTRTFKIPAFSPSTSPSGNIHIQIHEPSLTGDNLGHKTWVASYLLAKRLLDLFRYANCQTSCKGQDLTAGDGPPRSTPADDSRLRVLELGAGTGLVGLAAAASFSIKAHLTDLESIVENLEYNIEENRSLTERSQSNVTSGVLDWSTKNAEVAEEDRYDIILAADSLYAPQHPNWLAVTMDAYLTKNPPTGRIFVELPFREATPFEHEPLHGQLRREMGLYFLLEREGEEIGYDDWECNTSGDRVEVRCWWSVWRRMWASN